MPELPEVETVLRGIQPHIQGQRIKRVTVRHYGLRWPVPRDIDKQLAGKQLLQIERRAKYLLFKLPQGTVILHLGMSGSLRVLTQNMAPQKHDHIDIEFSNKKTLRFTDPRRFGACLWTDQEAAHHPLLSELGPEPLSREFTAKYLIERAHNRNVPIKSFIMDNKIVVGVGNIYAAEALFLAGVHPMTPTKKMTVEKLTQLTQAIKSILRQAIKRGGTTLKDFVNSDGKPGYFANQLNVYGRDGLPCVTCGTELELLRIGQRSTVYCRKCQK